MEVIMKDKPAIYRLKCYIDAIRSEKLDHRCFADLDSQRALFRAKALEEISGLPLNWSEVMRQAEMPRSRWADIQRGKTQPSVDDLASICEVLEKHFA